MEKWLTLAFITPVLFACTHTNLVPVREGAHTAVGVPVTTESKAVKGQTYIVQPGDTIYSIAWNYNLDYRDLAAINNIPSPYHLHAGQDLQLVEHAAVASHPVTVTEHGVQTYAVTTPQPAQVIPTQEPTTIEENPPPSVQESALTNENAAAQTTQKPAEKAPEKTITETAPKNTATQTPAPTNAPTKWIWPAQGKVTKTFGKQSNGIDIEGNRGDPIYATAAGQVVYSGTGLRGYGQLIIIKHSPEYLTAYAHNSVVLVAEGDSVKQGQKIAEMGDTGTNKVKLHFELRVHGKPVDPQKHLPRK